MIKKSFFAKVFTCYPFSLRVLLSCSARDKTGVPGEWLETLWPLIGCRSRTNRTRQKYSLAQIPFWEQIKMKLHNSAGIWRLSENTNTRTVEKANLQQMDECGVKVNSSWALAISRRSSNENISKKGAESFVDRIWSDQSCCGVAGQPTASCHK